MPGAVAVVAVVAIAVVSRAGPADVGAARALSPSAGAATAPAPYRRPAAGSTAAPVPSSAITRLRSRVLDRATIEIWGRTSAPDGTSIILRLAAPGLAPVSLPEAPAAGGRFYTRARIPAALQGRRLDVRALAFDVIELPSPG